MVLDLFQLGLPGGYHMSLSDILIIDQSLLQTLWESG
jgi:hypothetical protein